jgi:polysaccharide biosynthesis/export protein
MNSRLTSFRDIVLLIVLGALAPAIAAEPVPPAGESPYLLQPGDVITVSVWKEPELQSEVLLRPDGGMSFPLAGDIAAAGKSVQQVASLIDTRLRAYIPKPVVTVALKQMGGNRVYVIGKVNRPGEFPFVRPIDVMQALALAGGATSYADLNDIQILRRGNDKQVSIRFKYGDVERGRELGQNILLQSGDTIVVP